MKKLDRRETTWSRIAACAMGIVMTLGFVPTAAFAEAGELAAGTLQLEAAMPAGELGAAEAGVTAQSVSAAGAGETPASQAGLETASVGTESTERTFDGQTFTIIEEDCTINIPSDIAQKQTLVIKSGNVTINGNGHTIAAADQTEWGNVVFDSGIQNNFKNNSIVVLAGANVTVGNLTIDYTGIGHGGAVLVANQVIDVAGLLTANNLNIVKAPDRALNIASGGTCTFNGGTISGYSDHGVTTITPGVDVYGTFTMTSGEICDSGVYAIDVREGGIANLNGGSIHGIHDSSSGDPNDYGAIVWSGGSLVIDGGEIYDVRYGVYSDGSCELKAGALRNSDRAVSAAQGSFIMSGGEIKDVTEYTIVLFNDSSFTMTGGSIEDCSTVGALVYGSSASMTMTGGEISGCGSYGGIYCNSSLTVGGNARVQGNSRNVFLPSGFVTAGKTIAVSADTPLTENALIGVTMSAPGTFTSGLPGKGSVANFTSDSEKYYPGETENGEAALKKRLVTSMVSAIPEQVYTGSAIEPEITVKDDTADLAKGEDYTVAYKDNADAGTAKAIVTGVGAYAGTAEVEFTISPKPIVPILEIKGTFTYTGAAIKPNVIVKNGETVINPSEYNVSYSNNVNVGTATATVTDKAGGNYIVGDASLPFTIGRAASPANVQMHRLYNPYTGEHLYTGNVSEKDGLVKLGWKSEGIGWKAPKTSKTPVYRLYNPYAPGGDHHYTTSASERDYLVKAGWRAEGVGWYSNDAKAAPVYRLYNPNAATGTHFHTASKQENDSLVKLGWRGEGVGWYGMLA